MAANPLRKSSEVYLINGAELLRVVQTPGNPQVMTKNLASQLPEELANAQERLKPNQVLTFPMRQAGSESPLLRMATAFYDKSNTLRGIYSVVLDGEGVLSLADDVIQSGEFRSRR